jgi:hypothetical protein
MKEAHSGGIGADGDDTDVALRYFPENRTAWLLSGVPQAGKMKRSYSAPTG